MKPFSYARPTTREQVFALLAGAARVKGAGYDLLDLAKRGVASPTLIVELSRVGDLPTEVDRIAPVTTGPSLELRIGARVTLAALAASKDVVERCPVLADAAREAATPQIRNVATVAGNLLQRPRCAYFRDPFFDCLRRGGTSCPAREGIHEEMAIYANAKCCAAHPSNLATALVALEAIVNVLEPGANQERGGPQHLLVPYHAANGFFMAPEQDPLRDSVLGPEAIVVSIDLRPAPASAYVEINQKQSYDWASVACAAVLDVKDGKVADARIALGAVAPVPLLSKPAADALRGKAVTDETAWAAAGEAATQGATPLPRNGHKVQQLRVVVRRAIAAAAARATGGK